MSTNMRLCKFQLFILFLFFSLLNSLRAQCDWEPVGPNDFDQATSSYAISQMVFDSQNIPYICFSDEDNGMKPTVRKFTGSKWINVGIGPVSYDSSAFTAITIDSNDILYVAYKSVNSGGKLNVKKFDGTSWLQVGSANFNNGIVTHIEIKVDKVNTPYVLMHEYNQSGHFCSVMRYDSNTNNWIVLGTIFGVGPGFIGSLNISSNNTPFICVWSNGGGVSVLRFDGSQWMDFPSQGSFYSTPNQNISKATLMLLNDSIPWVVLNHANIVELITTDSSNNWVGIDTFSTTSSASLEFSATKDINNAIYVAYSNNLWNRGISIVKKTANGLVELLNDSTFQAFIFYPDAIAIDKNGNPYVCSREADFNQKTIVRRYNGQSWAPIGTTGISNYGTKWKSSAVDIDGSLYIACTIFDSDFVSKLIVKKQVGSNWVDFGKPIVDPTMNYIIEMAIDKQNKIPYLVYTTNSFPVGQIKVKKFDGINNWITLDSSSLSGDLTDYPKITIDNNGVPYILVNNYPGSNALAVKKLVSNQWVTVGTTFSSNYGITSVITDNFDIPHILVERNNFALGSARAKIMKLSNFNTWVNATDTSIFVSSLSFFSPLITFNSKNDIYVSSSPQFGSSVKVWKHISNQWNLIGDTNVNGSLWPSLVIDKNDNLYLSSLSSQNRLSVYQLKGNAWIPFGSNEISSSLSYSNQLHIDTSGTLTAAYLSWSSMFAKQIETHSINSKIIGTQLVLSSNVYNSTSYQWLNCSNGMTPIANTTSQTFVPVINGSYAVVVDRGGCLDTSVCIIVTSAGLSKVSQDRDQLSIHPNPSIGQFNIEAENKGLLIISDAIGKEIVKINIFSGSNQIDLSEYTNGMYIAKFISVGQQNSYKLMLSK